MRAVAINIFILADGDRILHYETRDLRRGSQRNKKRRELNFGWC